MDVPDQPPQRILVVHNAPARTPAKGVASDAISEQEVVAVAREVEVVLRERGHEVHAFGVTGDLAAFLATLDRVRPDVVFNLCEGIDGDEHHEHLIVQILEFRRIAYTGCPARALADSNDKERAKVILRASGVPVPESWLVDSLEQAGRPEIRFRAIVKPVNENASLGIGIDSVVTSRESLLGPVKRVLESYRQPAMVERYIEGREFNVSVLGGADPEVLPISEIDYSGLPRGVPRILFYEAKWMEDSPYYLETPVVCPARNLSEKVAERIRQIARRSFVAMGCRGYARVDLRVSRGGTPYVLEVNGNPSLASNAGLARSARQAGLDYPALIGRILDGARPRRDPSGRAGGSM